MGDRRNIKMDMGGGEVYFYTHWGGSELPKVLASALSRGKSRWDDTSYLARIIFCEMVKNEIEGTTGYGIDYQEGDKNQSTIVVDCKNQHVILEGVEIDFNLFIEVYG